MKKKITIGNIIIHIFFIVSCLTFIVPFLYIISASLSSEENLIKYGYSLFTQKIDFTAYNFVFADPGAILTSYGVTIFESVVCTILAVIIMALCAYPLSKSNFGFRSIITFFIFFTMLFSGGLIPTYILITKYLKLGNTIWVYILPALASPWHIIIIRTFFQGLPNSLSEAAKIDGAKELTIFFRIILPLSKPVLATIALFTLLGRWNDWMTSLIYVRNENLYTLQYLLQRILRDIEFVNNMANSAAAVSTNLNSYELPIESMKFAMCVVAAGPMLVVFPFFQKYFARGLTVGAVKG